MKRLVMATALTVAAITTSSWAQAQVDSDPHHPSGGKKSAPVQAGPPSQPGMNSSQGNSSGMPMMNMMMNMMSMMDDMKNMMNSMPMLNMMAMMQTMGMGGIASIDHIEGQIAFLRTELKITDTQAGAWNAFADALRTNAQKLGEVHASMMSPSGDAQQQLPTIEERLDLQERWLLARLESTRTMKSAFTKLYEALSDDQKKTADDLLAPHMDMGMMAMMPGQMGPGMGPGRMQPGQMGPGRMQPGAR